METRIAKDQI